VEIRRPAPRPAETMALELLLTLLVALEIGILLTYGSGAWGDRGIGGGPVPGVLLLLAAGIIAGWTAWIGGRGGALLAAASLPVALISGLLLLLGPALGPEGAIDLAGGLLLLSAALAGIAAGIALPAPSDPRPAGTDGGRIFARLGAGAGRIRRPRPTGPTLAGRGSPPGQRGRRSPLPPAEPRRQPTVTTQPERPTATTERSAPPPPMPAPAPRAADAPEGRPGATGPATGSRFLRPSRSVSSIELPLDAPPPRSGAPLPRPLADLPSSAIEPSADAGDDDWPPAWRRPASPAPGTRPASPPAASAPDGEEPPAP